MKASFLLAPSALSPQFSLSPDGRALVVVEQMDSSVVWLVE
jgi:hypothetical protein